MMGESTLSKLATTDFGARVGIAVGGVLAWLTIALLGPRTGKSLVAAAAIGVFVASLVGTLFLVHRFES